jgi:hypothetical protein
MGDTSTSNCIDVYASSSRKPQEDDEFRLQAESVWLWIAERYTEAGPVDLL